MSVEFNLSGFLLDGNSAWDLVYYEKEETSAAGKIHLGAVLIEVYDQTTAAWYTIYNWGNGSIDANASYNNGNSEPDGFDVEVRSGGTYTSVFVGVVKAGSVVVVSAVIVGTVVCVVTSVPGVDVPAGASAVV